MVYGRLANAAFVSQDDESVLVMIKRRKRFFSSKDIKQGNENERSR